jgi:hypothetical protein
MAVQELENYQLIIVYSKLIINSVMSTRFFVRNIYALALHPLLR